MADGQSDSRGEARQSFFAKQQMIDSARNAFQLLSAVLRNVTLYPAAHPILVTSADKLRARIEDLLVGRKAVAFYLVSGELFFEKNSVPVDQGLALLMEHFTSRSVGGVVFRPGLETEEIIQFSSLMHREPVSFTRAGSLDELLAEEHIHHIELHRVALLDKQASGAVKAGKKKAAELFQDALDSVKDMVHAVHVEKAFNTRKMNSVVQTMVDSVLDNRDSLMGLTSIKMYDEYTFAHSVNVSILAVSLGTFLSFDKPQVAALGLAGLMHDVGKVNIPHEIINKPGVLTPKEWEAIKRHPVEGALMLADVPGMSKLAMVAAFEHHRRGAPGDYPELEGEARQHPFTQIITLADAYEALTAARVYYHAQMPVDHAVRMLLQKRGETFNAVLVKAFVNMVGIFPIGTLLKLDTGEVGLVLHQTRDLLRPRVLILTKFDGSEKEGGADVSLLETEGGRFLRSVVGTIDPYAAKIDIKRYLGG